jgi:hypothetical protein
MVRASALLPLLLPPAVTAQAIVAEPRQIEGRIVDVLGEPVPAAEVRAFVDGRAVARTHADGEGIYCIAVPAGAELRFAAPDKAEVRRHARGAASARVHNVVLEDGATLRGKVRDAAGAGVPHAVVVVLPPPRLDARTATTGADGTFELRNLPLRPLFVRATGDAGWTQTFVGASAATELDLTLRDADGLSTVHVRGLTPAAVAGAAVRIYGGDLAAVQNGGRLPLRADGTATLLLQQDSLVDVVVPGAAVAPQARYVTPGERRVEFAVAGPAAAAPTARVRGALRTAVGKPVAGARVLVRDRSHRDLGIAVSDRDGAFAVKIERPLDGFVRIGLALAQWMPLADELTIADGCVWLPHRYCADELELFVERVGIVRCALHADEGSGFVLAEVVANDAERSGRRALRTHTDRTGNLELPLPPGRHELLAVGHDGAVRSASVTIDSGRVVQPEWRHLATGTITGEVRDRDGRGVPGVELFVLHDHFAPPSERDHCRIVTDRHGRFRCRGLPAGDWRVTPANDSRFTAADVVVRAGRETVATIALAR